MNFNKDNNILYYQSKPHNIDEINKEDVQNWLTSILKSKHLALLIGSGLTTGLSHLAGLESIDFNEIASQYSIFQNEILQSSESQAFQMNRGKSNFEDRIRVAMQLLQGLYIQQNENYETLAKDLKLVLKTITRKILETENNFYKSDNYENCLMYLRKLLISFASRSASKDRLHIFTTNYDRFIELGADSAGLFTVDRFRGTIKPKLRSSRMSLDFHYDPPGIRGEPRYLEGVIRLTKLHGSLDWKFDRGNIIKYPLEFGNINSSPVPDPNRVVIYPNSSKSIETVLYPYADLFRDFSNALCQPNSVLVVYGYGFGDSHINQIIMDMLTIPSTHLVVISFDNAGGRINKFINNINDDQLTLMIGDKLGDIQEFVDNYLPKSAIDLISKPYRELSQMENSQTEEKHAK